MQEEITADSSNVKTTETDTNYDKKALTSLILGSFGLIAWFIPIIGLPIQIIGMVNGIKGLKSKKRHGMAVLAIVFLIIGLVLSISNAAIGAYLGATGQHSLVNKLKTK